MDSYCATFGTSTHMSRNGLQEKESGFLGDRIRGGLKSNVLFNKLPKSLKNDQRCRKIKSGVAVSVLTSNNSTETLVSLFTLAMFLFTLPIFDSCPCKKLC